MRVVKVRRSTRSPIGTTNARPTAYPIWVAVTARPAVPFDAPKSSAIVSSNGCA